MRILSVDLGSRNLAWCVLNRTNESTRRSAETTSSIPEHPIFKSTRAELVAWRVVDITEEGRSEEEKLSNPDVNLNETDVATCVPWFSKTLQTFQAELTNGIELAVLEAQPTSRFMSSDGRCVNNVRTKVLSHILQAFLLQHGVSTVKFISPAVKLKHVDFVKDSVKLTASDYRNHKKQAVALTETCLPYLGTDAAAQWKAEQSKKDDLADCLLQGLCCSTATRQPKRKVGKKSKREQTDLMTIDDDEVPE